MSALFRLDPRLTADTAVVVDWPLCRVLVMNDSRFPWLILVPRRPNMLEIFDLEQTDRATLIDEIAKASARLKTWAHADKINVGALGNVVPQLHVHIVARKPNDPAGAALVWGFGEAVRYTDQELAHVVAALSSALK